MKKFQRLFGGKSTTHRNQVGGPSLQNPPAQAHLRVVDDNAHASTSQQEHNTKGKIFQVRGSWKSVHELYASLSAFADIKELIDKAGWSRLLAVPMPKSDNCYVEALVERWWDTTHTFHLPQVEIGITPYDFTFITGISVGRGILLPFYNDDQFMNVDATFQLIMPNLPEEHRRYYNGGIRLSTIKLYLQKVISHRAWNPDADNPETIASLFLLYTIGQLFFPNANSTLLPGWYAMVNDLNTVVSYDWGSSILARVFYALDACSRTKIKSIDCFWQFIEYLMYEYTITSTPVLINPNTDYWPRILKWTADERVPKTHGAIRNNFASAQQQLEIRSADSIRWQPYAGSQWRIEELVNIALVISCQRILLWDPQLGCTWYLGDRSYRQLTNIIVIPKEPPTPMSKIPFDEFVRRFDEGWDAASDYFTEASQEEFDTYWRLQSSGSIMPPFKRYVNTDGIGLPAMQTDTENKYSRWNMQQPTSTSTWLKMQKCVTGLDIDNCAMI